MTAAAGRPQFWPEIQTLMLAAMAIFVYTIVIGILNGTDIVEFGQRRILGHVHGGTLGWLTLSVFAAALWLFGETRAVSSRERTIVRVLIAAAIISFVAYVYAFSTTYGKLRPTFGTTSTIVIAGFFLWVVYRARNTTLTVPHWGFLAALGTSIAGGVLGVLLGLELATGDNYLTDGGEDAHPGTMVVGFLIPVALAMAEWAFFFPNPPKATRAGIIQMVFPFVGGVLLLFGLLLDITPLAALSVFFELIGVGIFVYRMWPSIRALRWDVMSAPLHGVAGAVGVIFVIGLAQYFIIRYEADFDLVPDNQLLALDHLTFIGAMTNAVFAMLLAATVAGGRGNRLHYLVFILVNLGLVGFAGGLLFDVTVLKRIFAPIMGVGLLIGLAVYALGLLEIRLFERTPEMAPAE